MNSYYDSFVGRPIATVIKILGAEIKIEFDAVLRSSERVDQVFAFMSLLIATVRVPAANRKTQAVFEAGRFLQELLVFLRQPETRFVISLQELLSSAV